jgi:hypothetical protein
MIDGHSDNTDKFLLESQTTGRAYEFFGSNNDPWFTVIGNDDDNTIVEGDKIVLYQDTNAPESRSIFSITIVHNYLIWYRELLAPRQVFSPREDAPYLMHKSLNSKALCALRPGTTILGGRKTGFYDSEGLILSAQHYGGDPARFEDWVFLVTPLADHRSQTRPNWVTLNDIFAPISEPNAILKLDYKEEKIRESEIPLIDFLIKSGERELVDYLSISPGTLRELTPRQFESAVTSVFRSMGFTVEPVGSWNQADGGVDLIAVSKTLAGAEFRIAIQCKSSKNKVSAKPIRELAAVLPKFRAHQGIVATSSDFTKQARSEQQADFWQISLEDGAGLYEKIRAIIGDRIVRQP